AGRAFNLGMKRAALFAPIVCVLAACQSRHADANRAAPTAGATAEEPVRPRDEKPPADSLRADDDGRKQPPGQPRKIIRTGEIRITVDGYDGARDKLDAIVRDAGGFVANMDVTHAGGGGVASA